jgi:hypothetical protein
MCFETLDDAMAPRHSGPLGTLTVDQYRRRWTEEQLQKLDLVQWESGDLQLTIAQMELTVLAARRYSRGNSKPGSIAEIARQQSPEIVVVMSMNSQTVVEKKKPKAWRWTELLGQQRHGPFVREMTKGEWGKPS